MSDHFRNKRHGRERSSTYTASCDSKTVVIKVPRFSQFRRFLSRGWWQSVPPINTFMADAVNHMNEIQLSRAHIRGISTGLGDFDFLTEGLQPGDLMIIGGRPSMGKTALATSIALHVTLTRKRPAVIFSMDMSGAQISMRLIAALGKIELSRIRAGRLEADDLRRERWAIEVLNDAPLFVDEAHKLSISQLRARARRLKRKHPNLSLLVVDYLQLMLIPECRDIRSEQLASITRALKSLARELNVPVIALSQVARRIERRPNKRPLLGDLIGSGSIEEQADTVVMLYRDEYYVENSPERGVAELIVAKQKNGPTGTVRVGFREQYALFESTLPLFKTFA